MPDIGNPEGTVHNPAQEVQAQAERLEQMTADEVTREIRNDAQNDSLLTRAGEVEVLASSLTPLDGDATDPSSNKAKGREALLNAQKMLLAIKQGKLLPPDEFDTETKAFVQGALNTIASSINPEVLDDRSGAFVYDFLSDIVRGDVPNIDTFIRHVPKLGALGNISPRIFMNAQRALFEVAENSGLSQEDVVERIAPERETIPGENIQETEVGGASAIDEQARELRDSLIAQGYTPEEAGELVDRQLVNVHGRRARGGEFDELWGTYFSSFYDTKDKEMLRAITSPEATVSYLAEKKEEVRERLDALGKPYTKEDLGKEVSREFEREVVLTFSKLFQRVDREKPTQFFEEITQQGYYDSIEIVFQRMKRQLQLVVRHLSSDEVPEGIRDIPFFQSYSIQEIATKEVGEGAFKKDVASYRIIPTPGKKEVSIEDYLSSVLVQVDHEYNTRAYLHNVKALFYQGVSGDETFWGKLGGYAAKFPTTDIDAMMLLPDSDLFMTAQRLYTKYVEEAFAQVSWIHQPNMFSTNLTDNYSEIEKKVFDDLKKMRPDIDPRKDDWRFKRAMSMAIGLSRGVIMTEAEAAAWADPHMTIDTKDGTKATFTSYYTNDNAALNALNPLHHFMRWQTEGVIQGPLLFLKAAGYTKEDTRIWDHKDLWDQAEGYRQAFIKGRAAHKDGKSPEELLFIELLPNIGKVGSFITRAGWRYESAEGWMVRDEKGALKLLDSWKAIENIGYDTAFNFVNTNIDGKVGDPETLKYIYQKYIRDGSTGGKSYDEYRKQIVDEVGPKIKQLVKEGKIELKKDKKRADQIVEKIEIEATRIIAHRGLAHMMRQRMPTKFLRVDRDRFSENGKSDWRVVMEDLGWDEVKMDKVMGLLLQVEVQGREDISQKMREHLAMQPDKAKDLSTFNTDEYRVTKEKIREVLTRGGRVTSAEDISDTLTLFGAIGNRMDEKYLQGFAEKIRNKNIQGNDKTRYFPFALGAEELDLSLLAYRSAGGSVLARALNDTGRVEKDIVGNIMHFVGKLKEISQDGKHDFGDIVKALKVAKQAMDDIHGKGYAEYVTFHMAALAIAYFKRDTVAKNIFTKPFTIGKKNSLAAEFIPGPFRGVWEWETSDIFKFMYELERGGVLSRKSKNLAAKPTKIGGVTLPRIFGRQLKIGGKLEFEKESPYSTEKLGNEMGASKKHVALEIANKYLPLIALLVLLTYIQKGMKDISGEKS